MAHADFRVACYACVAAFAVNVGAELRADDSTDTAAQVGILQQQNQALQEQLRHQQSLIESLNRKVNAIETANTGHHQEMEELQKQMEAAPQRSASAGLGKVAISAEGGAGYFHTGNQGMFPKGDFRVDEAKLFLETPVWERGQVYFFSEINLMTRESGDLNVKLGEAYIDFENVSRAWHCDRMLNIRLGRMDIPFGEEYIYRDAIDNPLISHSLSDFWGVDEGIEFYGGLGPVNYALAVQNGGASYRDFNGDKSVAGRLSYDPAKWLHLSVSGMRTGDLQSPNDWWSDLYFANGWFVPLGSTNVTKFNADLVEADVEFRLPHGHIKAFGGYARYDDDDTLADNGRDIWFYSVEAVHDIFGKLYGAGRFSQIVCSKGYPLVANGNMEDFLFGPLTKDIWRLSLGLGYRFSPNLVVKGEYTLERGFEVGEGKRNHEDLFGFEAAFKF